MRALDLIRQRLDGPVEQRSSMSSSEWVQFMGLHYPLGVNQTWTANKSEEPPPAGLEQLSARILDASPVVYAAVNIRKAVFSQALFRWRNLIDGGLFGNEDLALLERPWPGARTRKLLAQMMVYADLAGNAYVIPIRRTELDRPRRLSVLRPDWVTIVLGSELEADQATAEDAEFIGIQYHPGGPHSGKRPRFYGRSQVAHFAPMPDPVFHFRGMSWLRPAVSEVQADQAALAHKREFFELGGTPNMVIKPNPNMNPEQFREFRDMFNEQNMDGSPNAYKTMFLGGGADVEVVGSQFEQMDFKSLIGKAETRILMAAGVHPTVAGASEGMQGSSLNAGNYSQVRRLFSDVHLQDLWLEAAGALETLVKVPPASELTVDGSHIPFLQDDEKDTATIQQAQIAAITMAVRDGFTAKSVVAAVTGNDMTLLEHSGLTSVQLQEPGEDPDDDPDEGAEE